MICLNSILAVNKLVANHHITSRNALTICINLIKNSLIQIQTSITTLINDSCCYLCSCSLVGHLQFQSIQTIYYQHLINNHYLYKYNIIHTLIHFPQDCWPIGAAGWQKAVQPYFWRHAKGLLASQVAQKTLAVM